MHKVEADHFCRSRQIEYCRRQVGIATGQGQYEWLAKAAGKVCGKRVILGELIARAKIAPAHNGRRYLRLASFFRLPSREARMRIVCKPSRKTMTEALVMTAASNFWAVAKPHKIIMDTNWFLDRVLIGFQFNIVSIGSNRCRPGTNRFRA